MTMKTRNLFTFVGLLLIIVGSSFSMSAQPINLLIDPGFEGEQYTLISIDPVDNTTFSVPQGWSGGVAREPHSESWMNIQPTGFPHTGAYRWSGSRSLHIARGFATFTAWVYQQVSVTPSTDVQGGAVAFIESGATAIVRAGIHPSGGTNPFDPEVVWSSWSGNLYQWNGLSVSTRAKTGTVTLFLYATQSIPHNPNGVYWDDAFLLGTAGSGSIQSLQAPSNQQYVLPKTSVRIRSGAGINFQRIGAGAPGDAFVYKGESGSWYEIDFNGRSGFISKDFATLSSSPETGQTVPLVDALDFNASYTLRLRAAPSSRAAELAIIPHTTLLRATGRSRDKAWVQVTYNGQVGWVAVRYGILNGNINSLALRE